MTVHDLIYKKEKEKRIIAREWKPETTKPNRTIEQYWYGGVCLCALWYTKWKIQPCNVNGTRISYPSSCVCVCLWKLKFQPSLCLLNFQNSMLMRFKWVFIHWTNEWCCAWKRILHSSNPMLINTKLAMKSRRTCFVHGFHRKSMCWQKPKTTSKVHIEYGVDWNHRKNANNEKLILAQMIRYRSDGGKKKWSFH